MKIKCLVIFSWCFCCVQSFPAQFYQSVQFLPPARSFITRADEFHSNVKISNHINFNDVTSVFHHTFGNTFEGHITPDFSDGLSYPDPFLRTGGAAKRIAAYLYRKELFFGEIPHVRILLFNKQKRIDNGLPPHRLGSLRAPSPWYRF
ncbi:uncharacterized protein [Euwallacea fornicatus]|uniref:uncharacterized protein n=1 Tax=Euwallacea fornicatus TaxID=995702 RepID=UPI00338FDA42